MKRTSPVSKLCMLAVVLVLTLAPVMASATNPCPTGGCGYTWDPVERCCNAAPWSDCPDRCY
jgi:hypothetical protein